MIVVTYDEFGGAWDHVPPPGTPANPGPHDPFGPGTRVPALVISKALPTSGVDHSSHDTVSILSTIEHRFGVSPVTQPNGAPTRDVAVNDLSSAFRVAFANAACPTILAQLQSTTDPSVRATLQSLSQSYACGSPAAGPATSTSTSTSTSTTTSLAVTTTSTTRPSSQSSVCTVLDQQLQQTTDPSARQALLAAESANGCRGATG